MESTLIRALIGFTALTLAIVFMAAASLYAVYVLADGAWWVSMIIVIVAMGAEISVYSSTLHRPIFDWIHEPERQARAREAFRSLD